jgi:hypothetical protein
LTCAVAKTHANHLFCSVQLPLVHCAGIKLNDQGLELLRVLLMLEDRLCAFTEKDPPQPWGVIAHLTPVLFQWGAGELALLQSWLLRLQSTEDWRPVTQPLGCARSAFPIGTPLNELTHRLHSALHVWHSLSMCL